MNDLRKLTLPSIGWSVLALSAVIASGCKEPTRGAPRGADPAAATPAAPGGRLVLPPVSSAEPLVNTEELRKCEKGIDDGLAQADVPSSLRTYYKACAGVYAEAGCKQTVTTAADLEPAKQLPAMLEGCRAAYCPHFADKKLEACQPDFKADSSNTMRAWAKLHEAILYRDAGKEAHRLGLAMLKFYTQIMQRTGQKPGDALGAVAADAKPAK